jgi:hypothetical protein
MAAGGTAAEHNDAYSSNVSPLSGPGSGSVNITMTPMGVVEFATFSQPGGPLGQAIWPRPTDSMTAHMFDTVS